MKQKSYFKAASSLKPKIPKQEYTPKNDMVDAYLHYVESKMKLDALDEWYVRARLDEKGRYAKLMVEQARNQLAALENLAEL